MNTENIYTNNLLKKLNPAVLSAGASLASGVMMNDPDAQRLAAEIIKGETARNSDSTPYSGISGDDREKLVRFSQAISSAVWTRYRITNRLFDILKMTAFMDIGCGFTQRGTAFSMKPETTYYGIDLPAVTEQLIPAVRSVIGTAQVYNRITYHAVDATDGNALRSVIRGRAPLFISTEGVMMYLTVPEAISVTDNICSLLEEFGGVWVTADPEMNRLNELVINNMFGDDTAHVAKLIAGAFGKSAERYIYSNGLTNADRTKVDDFLGEHGFVVRHVMADELLEEMEPNDTVIGNIYKDIEFRIMTSKVRSERMRSPRRGEAMTVDLNYGEERTVMNITGRIDTITAPRLIDEYKKLKDKIILKKLKIDMGNVIYVSSAGIRALLIIFKELGGENFELVNLTPEVSEIFRTTGLTDVLQ